MLAVLLVGLLTGAGGTFVGMSDTDKQKVEVVGEAADEVLDGREKATSPDDDVGAVRSNTDPDMNNDVSASGP